ncbi:YoaK family protein [Brevundimonas sp.]|uniref:YoaK family protein n=1 Tax=Brevundimonas sp. TaxID=1871086 RepID=UPI00286C157F|nr:YoaK family protein [Brevundimonas sp.]
MLRYDRRVHFLAACFSGVAGYVDAIGFLLTGGFFVSFMSGNSTRLGIGMAEGSSQAGFAAVLLMAFVIGVMMGTITGRIAGRHRQVAVLGLVTLLLAIAVLLHSLGAGILVALPMVLAMGAENTVFAEDGEVRIGLTYMTGALVKVGKRLTTALTGGDRWSWLPFMLLWSGLAAGAVAGALAYGAFGVYALVGAVVLMAVMTLVTAAIGPISTRGPHPS